MILFNILTVVFRHKKLDIEEFDFKFVRLKMLLFLIKYNSILRNSERVLKIERNFHAFFSKF
jgi:hypothetical protein